MAKAQETKFFTPMVIGITVCAVLVVAICGVLLWGLNSGRIASKDSGECISLVSTQVSDEMTFVGTLEERGAVLVGVLSVPASQATSVKVGDQVLASCPDAGDVRMQATVSDIRVAAAAPTEGIGMGSSEPTYEVIIMLGNAASGVEAGMGVTAVMTSGNEYRAFTVPATALGSNMSGSYVVAVYENGVTEQIPVAIMDVADDDMLVISGAKLTDGLLIRTQAE